MKQYFHVQSYYLRDFSVGVTSVILCTSPLPFMVAVSVRTKMLIICNKMQALNSLRYSDRHVSVYDNSMLMYN